jgi:hypothetical protein
MQYDTPVSGTVGLSQYSLYRLIPPQSKLKPYTLSFQFNTLTGHVSAYVSCGTVASRDAWMWSKSPVSGTSTDYLSIESIDLNEKGCLTSSSLYLSIYGDSAASYRVAATLGNQTAVTSISLNNPISRIVANHKIDYYYVRINSGTMSANDLYLSLTIYNGGNADLYVSTSWEKRAHFDANGNVVSYDYSSDVNGDDYIALSHKYMQRICEGKASSSGDGCYFVIAVVGTSSNSGSGTSYTLEVRQL